MILAFTHFTKALTKNQVYSSTHHDALMRFYIF